MVEEVNEKVENIKSWILLALSNSQRENGINVTEFILNPTPPSFKMDIVKLFRYLKQFQNEGLVNSSGTADEKFTMTSKGKKELRRLLRSNPDESKKIIECFPEIELRKRIETIEAFIFGSVLMVTSYLMLDNKITSKPYLNDVLIVVLFFSFGFAGSSMLSIFSSVTEKLKISMLTRTLDILEDNKNKIGYILVVLANIVGYFVLTTYLDYTTKQIIGIAIVEIIIGIWLKIKTIVNCFKKIKWIKD